jgi:succinate dehydrogenase hydrophobic anchor subunit
MSLKFLGKLEGHAFFILFTAAILVLLWHGIWGLADNLEHHLQERHGIKKPYFNVMTIFAVVLIIGLYPQILNKL